MVNSNSQQVLLTFDSRNRLLVREDKKGALVPTYVDETGEKGNFTDDLVAKETGLAGKVHFLTRAVKSNVTTAVYCIFQSNIKIETGHYYSLDEIQRGALKKTFTISPVLEDALEMIEPHLAKIPYLGMGENEYIYRFRTLKERNTDVYIDKKSQALYQSKLCNSIKAARRIKEKKSSDPAVLDFGVVSYMVPSHFGFCLGVQNAIERAYETVAENPKKRVFMLSELIHNSFVNQDLLARGIRYLQTEKGKPFSEDGSIGTDHEAINTLWNQLTSDDIVIIPAFGATNEDKVRLIRKGIDIRENDATCMLVEKVWKAARRYAKEGYTVLIHGKSEHEETKATFSNSSSYGPALMIRNMEHAKKLVEVIKTQGGEKKRLFEDSFEGLYSKGFDPQRDLQKLAVVNQTTLLRNETLKIIEFLHTFIVQHYGEAKVADHLWLKGKGDTLCYATQVNQDALQRAIEQPVDAALVVGGKNSSNTYQLYRVCEKRFGKNAHFIQSEDDILSAEKIRHHIFTQNHSKQSEDNEEVRPFLKMNTQPKRILLTGGASCPDGIIQQVIHKINSFFPETEIRSIDSVLQTFEEEN
ncbi:MAG: 4-hydroxy-3-methylbut-2-enyl diphosphate reductase [Lentimonas sp.]|jgi:4-hydroxy-3-methylbut-2-enyl diphosphate reductase